MGTVSQRVSRLPNGPPRPPGARPAIAKKHSPHSLVALLEWSASIREINMKQVFQPLKRKHHSLTGRITPQVALKAFKAVKRNRGAAGIDKVSLQMFEANLDDNLAALIRQLKDGSFRPRPLRRRYIPKGDGKMRPLGIPSVRDRVAQEILRTLLDPIFEPQFHPHSFGFRAGRNCHQALRKAIELHDVQGLRWVLDADIEGFFDNLPHPVIMQAVAAQIADGNILRLIESFLSAGVMESGVFKPTTVGTPQGGVISPPSRGRRPR